MQLGPGRGATVSREDPGHGLVPQVRRSYVALDSCAGEKRKAGQVQAASDVLPPELGEDTHVGEGSLLRVPAEGQGQDDAKPDFGRSH